MGFVEIVRALFASAPRTSAAPAIWDLSSGHGYGTLVRGALPHERRLRKMYDGGQREFLALLAPPSADGTSTVSVRARSGERLGYLTDQDGVRYLRVLHFLAAHQLTGACRAKLVSSAQGIDIQLDLKDADAVLEILTERIHSPVAFAAGAAGSAVEA